MTTYKCSIGFDVATLDLVDVNPSPTSQGVKSLRRANSASGAVFEQGDYVELEWASLGSVTMYQALLTQFGILSSIYGPVTVLVRSNILSFTRYNGIAVRPAIGSDIKWDFFPRNVIILVKNLEQLVEP